MTLRYVGMCALLVGVASTLQAGAIKPDEIQMGVVRSYLEARAATMQEATSPGDVERVLALCTPNVVYEHPRAGMTRVGVATLRTGMVGFLGASRKASIVINESLQGRDMVAVRTAVSFEAQDGANWTPVSRSQVWVFELDGAKIKRIMEYW